MRTTVDLPDDLYEYARDRAHHQKTSLSQAVVETMRRGVHNLPDVELRRDELTGLLVMHFDDEPITSEQVRALLDDDE